jgi:hypothetical protein
MESSEDFRIPRVTTQNMSDEELFWAVIEPIWPDSEVHDELKRIEHGTPGQRALYTTTLFAREVDNGGLAQFLSNSCGMYAKYVKEGLRLLGADALLTIFLEALRLFPEGDVPVDLEARRKLINGFLSSNEKIFEKLDEKLYQNGSVEEQLYPYFKKYIAEHPSEFFTK